MTQYRRGYPAALLAALVALGGAPGAHASGMNGQPQPDPALQKQVASIVRDLLRVGGDKARARPSLLLLVEKHATADLTDSFSAILGDGETYSGLEATYQDALTAATRPADQGFIRYNLAHLVVLRALAYPPGRTRTGILATASDQLAGIEHEGARDPAIAELKGDIADAGGDIEGAVAAYGQMIPWGGSRATSAYKTGLAYVHARRYGLAARWMRTAAQSLASAPNSDPLLVHTYYQSLAATYLLDGDFGPAAQALRQSAAPLGSLQTVPSPLRIDVARSLLSRGDYAADVRVYLEAVARLEPDDAAVQSLLATARRGVH